MPLSFGLVSKACLGTIFRALQKTTSQFENESCILSFISFILVSSRQEIWANPIFAPKHYKDITHKSDTEHNHVNFFIVQNKLLQDITEQQQTRNGRHTHKKSVFLVVGPLRGGRG